MLRETAVIGAILLAFASPPVEDPFVDPPTENFSAQIVWETGCGGWVDAVEQPNNSTLQMWDRSEGLAVPPSVNLTGRETCVFAYDVSLPEGYTYAVARIVHRGMGELAEGVFTRLRTSVWFTGVPPYSHNYSFNTPMPDFFWETVHDIEPAARVWAPCGAPHRLRVYRELRLHRGEAASNALSYLTFNATMPNDGGTALELVWKRCSPETPLAGAGPGPTVDGMAHAAMTTTPGNPRRSTAMR